MTEQELHISDLVDQCLFIIGQLQELRDNIDDFRKYLKGDNENGKNEKQ